VSPRDQLYEGGELVDEAQLARRADRRDSLLTAGTFLSLLVLWTAVTGSGLWAPLVNPIFLPSPVAVGEAFVRLAEQGYQGKSLLHHVSVSLYRFAMAFTVCILIGVPLGLLMGMMRPVRAVFEPPIQAIRPIPKLALLPLFLIWFGIGNLSKIIVITAFPTLADAQLFAQFGVFKLLIKPVLIKQMEEAIAAAFADEAA